MALTTWENDAGRKVRTKHPGEWSHEPDKGHWIDEVTDLDCLIVRNRMGALCGYVGVPTGHPWHGTGYDDIEPYPEVGLTFSGSCFKDRPKNEGVCHVPAPGRDPDVWWIGFDCAHAHDIVPSMDELGQFDEWSSYKNWSFVTRECERLAQEVKESRAGKS